MKKGFAFLFFICIILFFNTRSFAQSSVYTSPCSQLIWQDEFDGTTFDENKWTYQIGDGCPNCGWGNGELQYYTNSAQNVHVENGSLFITALQESMGGKNYTAGRVITENKGDFTFGRIEARIKLPIGRGLWPAFWMLPTDQVYGGWPNSGEIDIMEYRGFEPNVTSGTLHYVEANLSHAYKAAIRTLPGAAKYSDDFHVFAIEWDSTNIKWFVDNTHFHTVTKKQIEPANWPFKHDFHIVLNVALGGLGGTPDASLVFPQSMEVDYVRVYSLPFNQSVNGPALVFSDDEGTDYFSLGNVADYDGYEWLVPSGAAVASGQGTTSAQVDWGNTSGDVVFRAGKDCDTFEVRYPVTVLDKQVCDLVFANNENINYPRYKSSSGLYLAEMNNSFKDAFNSSSHMARYKKIDNGDNLLTFANVPLESVSEFEADSKRFYLDVYSTLAVGSIIKLHMQSSAKAIGSYPAGIRNTFIGTTSAVSQWHRIYFSYASIDDATVEASEIDRIVFNFDPTHVDTKAIFFDNFSRVRVADGCTIISDTKNSKVNTSMLEVYPNPAKQSIQIEFQENDGAETQITLCNSLGEVVLENIIATTTGTKEIKIDQLSAGIYFIKAQSENQVYIGKFVKE